MNRESFLQEATGGRGEPTGVWDVEHEYPYEDHQWLCRPVIQLKYQQAPGCKHLEQHLAQDVNP
ncbi:hypothetical protein AAY473_026091 [Plecturocebus cupreus]